MSALPATVADLDLGTVVKVLGRYGCNVTDASADLGVPASDLRRLLWSNPKLQDEAFEVVEARLDKAEKNIAEALSSDDSRRRDAASFFVVRNSSRARRRGWITSASAGVDVTINRPQQDVVFHWRTTPLEVSDPDEYAKRRADEDAREKQLVGEGKTIVTVGWGEPPDKDVGGGQLIEHDPGERPEG
jgi:hypothetical protein